MKKNSRRGNCYVTTEALFHLLGGQDSGWVPMRMKHEGDSHWFLMRKGLAKVLKNRTKEYFKGDLKETRDYWRGILSVKTNRSIWIIDLTVSQFEKIPDYVAAKGAAFLTSKPSKRARALMKQMIWQ